MRARQEKPGAILLHHLWSGPPATQGMLHSGLLHSLKSGLAEAPPSDLAAFRTDNGVGMALLQQAWFVGWCSPGCYAECHAELRAMQVKKGANSGALKHAVPNCRGLQDLAAAKVPTRTTGVRKVLV